MNIDDYIESLVTHVIDERNSIIAIKGGQRKVYDKLYLTRCWLTMSNDSFYGMFGFNWVPPLELQEKVRQRLPWQEM